MRVMLFPEKFQCKFLRNVLWKHANCAILAVCLLHYFSHLMPLILSALTFSLFFCHFVFVCGFRFTPGFLQLVHFHSHNGQNVVTFLNQLADLGRRAATSKAAHVSDGGSVVVISAPPLQPPLRSNCEEFCANFSDKTSGRFSCPTRRFCFTTQLL